MKEWIYGAWFNLKSEISCIHMLYYVKVMVFLKTKSLGLSREASCLDNFHLVLCKFVLGYSWLSDMSCLSFMQIFFKKITFLQVLFWRITAVNLHYIFFCSKACFLVLQFFLAKAQYVISILMISYMLVTTPFTNWFCIAH